MERGQPQGRCGGLRGSCVGILPRWLQNGLLTSAGKGAREDVRARALSPATARPGSTQDVWCGVIAPSPWARGGSWAPPARSCCGSGSAHSSCGPASPTDPSLLLAFSEAGARPLSPACGGACQPPGAWAGRAGQGPVGSFTQGCAGEMSLCRQPTSQPPEACVSGPTLVGPTPGPHLHWPHPCCMCRQRRRGRSFSRSSCIPSIFGSTSH